MSSWVAVLDPGAVVLIILVALALSLIPMDQWAHRRRDSRKRNHARPWRKLDDE